LTAARPLTIRLLALELRIPPPAVAALIAGAMWGIAWMAPVLEVPAFVRKAVALTFVLAGAVFDVAAFISFRRARTTVNPMKPEKTSSFVSSGIYGVSRNPMYVGLLFILVAWAVFLSSAWALLGPVAFVLYINRFQIAPEERALSAMFGADYFAYRSRVRRWL
jgi:protein-S-isoprenylcysteine O-methyltransferase Ste14